MPLEENIATYSHFISEADKMKLAYICLMRYSEMMDPIVDGMSALVVTFQSLDKLRTRRSSCDETRRVGYLLASHQELWQMGELGVHCR